LPEGWEYVGFVPQEWAYEIDERYEVLVYFDLNKKQWAASVIEYGIDSHEEFYDSVVEAFRAAEKLIQKHLEVKK
jgi:hypothetical protein